MAIKRSQPTVVIANLTKYLAARKQKIVEIDNLIKAATQKKNAKRVKLLNLSKEIAQLDVDKTLLKIQKVKIANG